MAPSWAIMLLLLLPWMWMGVHRSPLATRWANCVASEGSAPSTLSWLRTMKPITKYSMICTPAWPSQSQVLISRILARSSWISEVMLMAPSVVPSSTPWHSRHLEPR